VLTTLNAAAVLCGTLVGLALGLAGMGSVFAVPLLVYGLGLGPHAAVCVSMVAVVAIALAVFARKSRVRLIELRVGSAIAAGGALGAPLGVWISKQLPPKLLLLSFAVFAAVIGVRMLFTGKASEISSDAQTLLRPQPRLQPFPRKLAVMIFVGLIAGVLSGLFGVGSGSFIIPALLFFAEVEMHRAVATSLPVVAVISLVAMTGHLIAGQRPSLVLSGLFAVGGVVGVELGSRLGARLDSSKLQRMFGVTVLAMAIVIAVRNFHAI
jgi:uncharacterized membrane protein YfcA